ncbi:MAG: hypothetical protein F9K46_14325 [Anaerolineae bacterium]|nr:MAG: hypothetical protein F9K46_14325 [Anaerolineae bacterium]
MDREFAGYVSPETAQVKAAAKAFFDSMELYMGAIQQFEDEIKRLQIPEEVSGGKTLMQYNEAEEQILTVKDAREYIAAHGVRLLTEGFDKTGKRVRWSV